MRKTKEVMDALVPGGSERVKLGKVKCPCCEKMIGLRSNGGLANLKQHLQRSKKPVSSTLLENLTALLKVLTSFMYYSFMYY